MMNMMTVSHVMAPRFAAKKEAPPMKPYVITLKDNVDIKAFEKALKAELKAKKLEKQAKDLNLLEMIGVVTLDCTQAVVDLARNMPTVLAVEESQTSFTC